jgi:uncharacterized protein (TIRG00374 family)
MRKFLIAIVILAGLIFIFTQLAELSTIATTLQRGDWRFLFLAFCIEMFWLVNVAASFRSIYGILGIKEKLNHLLLISAAANFVNTVMPSGGVGGMTVIIAEARRKEYSTGLATVAAALYVFFDYAAFACVLATGFIVLIRRDKLDATEIVAAGVILMIEVVLATVLYLGAVSEKRLGNFLSRMARMVNASLRIFRKKSGNYLSEERAYTFAADIAEGMNNLRRRPKELLLPFLLALSNKSLLITILFLSFMAFEVPLSAGTLIAGFSIAFLFLVVSPTPSGVGFVEGALTLALISFYIPLEEAAVVTIAYRAITFWVPLFIGLIAFRYLGGMKKTEPPEELAS